MFRLVDAAQYLSRLRKTIESRRQKDDGEKTTKNKNQQKASDNVGKQNYFQVEISKRHSGGSEAYSVIEDADGDDYKIIDLTGLIPRAVNCSPLSLHTYLAGPDLIRDLPPPLGKKVGRSISFLSHGEYQRIRRTERTPVVKKINHQPVERERTEKAVTVKRSLSAVTESCRPQHR
jgi:hypothetical protein